MNVGTVTRWWVLALLCGCAAPTREVEAPKPAVAPVVKPVAAPVVKPVTMPVASEPGPVPALLQAAQGDGLIVSNKDGLVLLGADLKVRKVLSRERGRHLRIVGSQLFYFELKQPRLRALDLESGTTRTVAELARLRSDCFEGGRPADPLAYVQSAADLWAGPGELCMDVTDSPGKARTETINVRVDLTTGAEEQRRVAYFDGKVCGEGKAVAKPRLCTPTPEPGARQGSSPTGRWRFSTDQVRGETGEQDYALALLTEQASGRAHAILGRKLRAIKPGADPPVDACMITAQARALWLGRSDVLLIEGCRDRLSVVLADGRVEHRLVDDFVVVPAVQ